MKIQAAYIDRNQMLISFVAWNGKNFADIENIVIKHQVVLSCFNKRCSYCGLVHRPVTGH
jgi:hypothetical protein